MKQWAIMLTLATMAGHLTQAEVSTGKTDVGLMKTNEMALAQAPTLRYGADERVRQEYFDHVPNKTAIPEYARGGENNYFRFRTRLWMEQDLSQDILFKARTVNECRSWVYPDVSERPQKSTSEWPDEWVFDNLYLDARNLLDNSLDLRIGRQELMYGDGLVVLEGTPGDGSRTLYFNAIKATWKAIPKTEVDVFGIYNESEDELAINSAERDLSAYPQSLDGVTESGGGLYLKSKYLPALPYESYMIYKREGSWNQNATKNPDGTYKPPAQSWQTLDADRGVIENAQVDIGTFGFRLMPVLSESIKGTLEAAGQLGQREDADIQAFMANATLAKTLNDSKSKPTLKAAILCLSGDDPATKNDEGWNPIWARYPQFSDLYVFALDQEESAARWSNLIAPNIGFCSSPGKQWMSNISLYYLSSFEGDGAGNGKERGWLAKWRNDLTLKENWFIPKDKLAGHLQIEVLEPGDYYTQDDTSVFLRWEVSYAF